MTARVQYKGWLVALLLALVFIATSEQLRSTPRRSVSVEMQVALPLFVQVFMAAGDRYLAANLAAIRALVVATDRMRPEEFRILAKVQEDVSWLNPAHEDNYYIAFAILAQYGELDSAQTILARASRARFFDYQPSFFYAFNQWYYKHDPAGAAAWMREAAEKLPDPDQRLIMQNFAARWMDKVQDTELAIRVVAAMAKEARRKDFRAYLETRVARLRQLQQLRTAAVTYRERFGKPVTNLQELVSSGILPVLPVDPFGFGFGFDPQGEIVLRTSPPRS
ncbi:MAG: hypothetical protein M0P95_01300 [Sulfuritalea sp.]|jgi:hypothetical protein|nr:hypothetical protein [Sulfuritalea sp.]